MFWINISSIFIPLKRPLYNVAWLLCHMNVYIIWNECFCIHWPYTDINIFRIILCNLNFIEISTFVCSIICKWQGVHTNTPNINSRCIRHVLGVDKVTTSCGPQFQFKSIRHLIEIAIPSACTLPGMFVDCGTFTQMYVLYNIQIRHPHDAHVIILEHFCLYIYIYMYVHTRCRYHAKLFINKLIGHCMQWTFPLFI